jgi:hypothetical protein
VFCLVLILAFIFIGYQQYRLLTCNSKINHDTTGQEAQRELAQELAEVKRELAGAKSVASNVMGELENWTEHKAVYRFLRGNAPTRRLLSLTGTGFNNVTLFLKNLPVLKKMPTVSSFDLNIKCQGKNQPKLLRTFLDGTQGSKSKLQLLAWDLGASANKKKQRKGCFALGQWEAKQMECFDTRHADHCMVCAALVPLVGGRPSAMHSMQGIEGAVAGLGAGSKALPNALSANAHAKGFLDEMAAWRQQLRMRQQMVELAPQSFDWAAAPSSATNLRGSISGSSGNSGSSSPSSSCLFISVLQDVYLGTQSGQVSHL